MLLGGKTREQIRRELVLELAQRRVERCAVEGCTRPAGHGHFAAYCEPCSDLPYGAGPA